MGADEHRSWEKARSFLGALRRDVRGNTLAMMGMALIPLAGMVGGGVDISRMYIVKTRLQHACDAGALAGRKAMGGGTWSFNSYSARTAAEKFFDANYNSAAYGATGVTRTYTENAGKVSGAASATLPMTLMRVFGRTTETLSVLCDAEMRLPNTDIMFVLDTTGSMDEIPSGDNQTKIAGLRVAVKCFYEIVARYDTDAACVNGTPGGGTGNQVQIRFGFMPYSTNVNVGHLLQTSWVSDTALYQTRRAEYQGSSSVTTYPNVVDSNGPTGNGNGDWSDSSSVSGGCPSDTTINQTSTVDTNVTYESNNKVWYTRTYSRVEYDYSSGWFGSCSVRTRPTGSYTSVKHTAAPVTTQVPDFRRWDYGQFSLDVSGLKNGSEWRQSFTLPIGNEGASKTINWDGCIEERQTTQTTDFDPIPAAAKDLDFDSVPTSDDTTKWKPALPDVIFTRQSTGGSGTNNWNRDAVNNTTANYTNTSAYYCPTEAKRLQTWSNATDFDDYVDSLRPAGNTYHDIGLLWGARFASPTGIFGTDNDYTAQGGEIERHIIFMTDGDTNTSSSDYNAYGIPWFDRRQTTSTSQTDLDNQVDLRFAALCTKIKNTTYNGKAAYTLWVISFGTVSTDTATRLSNCATTGRYFSAANAATLQSTFKSIADQISQLRLTK